jgi:vitamin B12 transporter
MSLFYIFLFLFSFQIRAEEILQAIEVTAEKELSDFHLSHLETLNSQTFERQNSALLSESLEDVSGFTSTQNGGPGGRVSYFIRGTEARHVSFTIDNLKINDPSNTDRQFDSAFLLTPFLKEVTLYKGPQAVLFGSDAMGGLIHMKSRKGESAPETRLSINAGSFGTIDSSLSKDWNRGDKHQGSLTWSSLRTDGISRLNKKRFEAKERDGADITQLTSSSKHRWAKSWESDLLISFLRGNNELDGMVEDNSHDEARNDQYLIQQKTNFELNSQSAIALRNGLSRHQRKIKTESSGSNSYESNLIQNEFTYNRENKHYQILLGLGHEQEEYLDSSLEEEANLFSTFIQSAFKKDSLKFQIGMRLENHSRYGSFQTGSTGIEYSFGSQAISLQYSQGYKAPSLYQLYGPDLFGQNIGYKDLVPERNHSWVGQWLYSLEDISIEASVFRNNLANLIAFTNEGFRNQNDFISEGIELGLDAVFGNFRVKPSLVHQAFRDSQGEILRRPNRQYNLKLAYFAQEALEFYSNIQFFSERMDIAPGGDVVKLNEFETVEVGSRFEKGSSSYGVLLKNVLDRNYEEVYGYSVMPRSVFLHYGKKF